MIRVRVRSTFGVGPVSASNEKTRILGLAATTRRPWCTFAEQVRGWQHSRTVPPHASRPTGWRATRASPDGLTLAAPGHGTSACLSASGLVCHSGIPRRHHSHGGGTRYLHMHLGRRAGWCVARASREGARRGGREGHVSLRGGLRSMLVRRNCFVCIFDPETGRMVEDRVSSSALRGPSAQRGPERQRVCVSVLGMRRCVCVGRAELFGLAGRTDWRLAGEVPHNRPTRAAGWRRPGS